MASEERLSNPAALIKELFKAAGYEVVKVRCERTIASYGRVSKDRFLCLGVRLKDDSECPLSAIVRQVMDEEPGHSDDSVVETGVVVYALCEYLSKPKRRRSGNMIWWPALRVT